jgi:DNA polymerase III alpha subunit
MEKNSAFDQLITLLHTWPINRSKLNLIKDKTFIEQESNVVLKMKHGVGYYKHIIHNKLLKDNTINSYIMWIYDIVDTIDLSKPTKIIPSRISMPDIDVDVPIDKREQIIDYIKNKYGQDKVSQMITFNTIKGRGALKDVLRVYGNISFDEMNKITKNIPDEAKIADELQEMKEETGESSIIRWALENNVDKLKEWCYIDDTGELQGPLAKRFEQAIRLEGTKSNQSKHAAGIAISSEPLNEICPMVYDSKNKQLIAGMEMQDLESIGIIKFDILGIAYLDKIMTIKFLLQQGVLV